MQVTLNIQNDEQLRSYIQDLIKGQVLSIVREELKEMIQTELERKIKGFDKTNNFDYIVKLTLREGVRSLLQSRHNVVEWNTDYIKPFADRFIEESMKSVDFDRLVNQVADAKVQSIIKGLSKP